MSSEWMTQEQIAKITQVLREVLPLERQQETRVRDYYLKILAWVVQQVRASTLSARPLILGVNGPQGSGKSTLTAALVRVLPELGLRAVTLSIDDFYLTRQEQVALAAAHSSNPLLQQRGYPGTHDLDLGLEKLAELCLNLGSIRIPFYDKSKYQGQGDRLPETEWTEIQAPLDVVFLEGWMLGFAPVSEAALLKNVRIQADPLLFKNFLEVNQLLLAYQCWYEHLDAFIHLIPQEIDFVLDWRVEAEERMKAQGKSGMSREEITAYISKFILAYQVYLPRLREVEFLPGKTFSVVLSKERLPAC